MKLFLFPLTFLKIEQCQPSFFIYLYPFISTASEWTVCWTFQWVSQKTRNTFQSYQTPCSYQAPFHVFYLSPIHPPPITIGQLGAPLPSVRTAETWGCAKAWRAHRCAVSHSEERRCCAYQSLLQQGWGAPGFLITQRSLTFPLVAVALSWLAAGQRALHTGDYSPPSPT